MNSTRFIKDVISDETMEGCVKALRASFRTVADEFGLTEENASSNAAFITVDKLKDSIVRGTKLFIMIKESCVIGTVAIEKSKDNDEVFFLEKIAVIPEERHNGYGKELLNHAINEIRINGGKNVSIGIINENHLLKKWYSSYGFVENGLKKFAHLPFTVCFMELNVK